MSIRQTLMMAFKSIAGNKLRSFLTMLGIIIGVASVISLVSVTQAQMNIYLAQMSAMGVNRIDLSLPWGTSSAQRDKILDYCEQHIGKELAAFSPNTQTHSLTLKYRGKKMDNMPAYFGNEHYSTCISYPIAMGRDFTAADMKASSRVCIIGEAVRKEFFGAMSPIGQTIKIGNTWQQNFQSYKVVGVYSGKYKGALNTPDQMVVLPHTQQIRLIGGEQYTEYVMSASDAESSIRFADALTEYGNMLFPPDSPNGRLYVSSNQQFQQEMQGMANQQSIVMGGIAGISLLVGGIGIMNIMLVSVTERTREIGIRMAIGARRRDIIGQFLIEAAVVSGCGGVIGILLGCFGAEMLGAALLGPIMNMPGMAQTEISVSPSITVMLGAFLFSVLLGVIFGLYPANKASKMQPVDALRTQ